MMQQSTTGLEIISRAHQAELWRASASDRSPRTSLGTVVAGAIVSLRSAGIWKNAMSTATVSAALIHTTAEKWATSQNREQVDTLDA